ncbi:MAG: hypothetical protein HeimAB125_11170 [Candidatus Heimdallarchaeota archaeon AB_125]|nr:MAG: hypothetical protein HeimAB125_11170 [Candidatus Heimdallarchaeota archaeon AB_125]
MSVVAKQRFEEKGALGTYLSPQDLSQILAPGLRKASIVKSYFVKPEEDRTNRILEFTDLLSNIFKEHYPVNLVNEVIMQFQKLLPDFLEDYGTERYFTKNIVANHFLAMLDYRLTLVGNKLSPHHIENVRDLLGLKKGKTFSYFSMKKTQSELFASGYIQRKKNNIFSPMLKNKVSQLINEVMQFSPENEGTLEFVQRKAFDLIDDRIIPKIDIEIAALVMVSSLLLFYISDRGMIHAYWVFLENKYKVDLVLLKRKVYRYRSYLKKKNGNNELGLGYFMEKRSIEHGSTSIHSGYL